LMTLVSSNQIHFDDSGIITVPFDDSGVIKSNPF
jgi:hypothetical protein